MKLPVLVQLEQWWRDMRWGWFETYYLPRLQKRASFWQRVGAKDDLVIRTFADHRLVFHPSDAFIGHDILVNGDWQRPATERAIAILHERGLLKPGGAFVDVGANIGTQSIYAWLTGHFARIVAIEPSPAEFEMLQLNMQLNGLLDVSRCHLLAADATSREAVLQLNRVNRGDNRLVEGGVDGVRVQTRPLDEILAEDGLGPEDVSLVWMDAQGHEPKVLAGMARLAEAGVPMVIEFNTPDYGPEGTADFIAALSRTHDRFIELKNEAAGVRPLADLASLRGDPDIVVFRDRS